MTFYAPFSVDSSNEFHIVDTVGKRICEVSPTSFLGGVDDPRDVAYGVALALADLLTLAHGSEPVFGVWNKLVKRPPEDTLLTPMSFAPPFQVEHEDTADMGIQGFGIFDASSSVVAEVDPAWFEVLEEGDDGRAAAYRMAVMMADLLSVCFGGRPLYKTIDPTITLPPGNALTENRIGDLAVPDTVRRAMIAKHRADTAFENACKDAYVVGDDVIWEYQGSVQSGEILRLSIYGERLLVRNDRTGAEYWISVESNNPH